MSKGVLALDKFGGYSICKVKDPKMMGKNGCPHVSQKPDGLSDSEFIESTKEESMRRIRSSAKENKKIVEEIPTKLYDQASSALEGQKVSMSVGPTGVGKSSVIGSLAYDYQYGDKSSDGDEVVIVVPRKGIQSQFEGHGMYYKYLTYNKLYQWYSEGKDIGLDPSRVSLLCFDECHRAGADGWGDAVKKAIDETKGRVIGFTATPVRTDGVNVSSLFGKPNSEISVEEAFEGRAYTGTPKYITPYVTEYDIAELEKLKKKIQNDSKMSGKERLIKEIDQVLSMAPDPKEEKERVLTERLKEMLDSKSEKGKGVKILVFAESASHIKELRRDIGGTIKKNFKDIEIEESDYTSNSRGEKSEKFVSNFTNSDRPVPKDKVEILYSINIFNEGYHVDDLDMAIRTRRSKSEIINKQQDGRMLGSRNERGMILDFSGSMERFNYTDWKRIDNFTRKDSHYGYKTLYDDSEQIRLMKENIIKRYQDQKGIARVSHKGKSYTFQEFRDQLKYNRDRPRSSYYAGDWVKANIRKGRSAEWMIENQWRIDTHYGGQV